MVTACMARFDLGLPLEEGAFCGPRSAKGREAPMPEPNSQAKEP